MRIESIKKYVVNLKRRPDRMESFRKEMDFIGWDVERFDAVDTNSYVGCALSHIEIAKRLLDSNDQFVMVMEDDMMFMPYSKELLARTWNRLNEVSWDFFHLGPSVHRPLRMSDDILLDLTHVPPKEEHHRGIFGTTAMVYNRKVAELLVEANTDKIIDNRNYTWAVDQFCDGVIYPRVHAFGPKLPIVSQRSGRSDINGADQNPHYIITYNWNSYVNRLDARFFSEEYCDTARQSGKDLIV